MDADKQEQIQGSCPPLPLCCTLKRLGTIDDPRGWKTLATSRGHILEQVSPQIGLFFYQERREEGKLAEWAAAPQKHPQYPQPPTAKTKAPAVKAHTWVEVLLFIGERQ
jgi:hypothetical protein